MVKYCKNCGQKLVDEALFCPNCGEKVAGKGRLSSKKFLLLFLVILVLAILAVFLTNTLILNQTQIVQVDNVQFEIPADYVSQPLRTDVNVDEGVKSTSMGWSNDKYYLEIGVTRIPGTQIDSEQLASNLGGTPSKMFGYSGYYIEYENEGCAFVFGLEDEVCMVYVSDYDAFSDVKVIG